MASHEAVGVVDLGQDGGRAAFARRGDLKGVSEHLGGALGPADLLQQGSLGQQGDEIIGLDGQGVIDHRQRAVEVAHQPKGQGPVQYGVVGAAAQFFGLANQIESPMRVHARQTLTGLPQQVGLGRAQVHEENSRVRTITGL